MDKNKFLSFDEVEYFSDIMPQVIEYIPDDFKEIKSINNYNIKNIIEPLSKNLTNKEKLDVYKLYDTENISNTSIIFGICKIKEYLETKMTYFTPMTIVLFFYDLRYKMQSKTIVRKLKVSSSESDCYINSWIIVLRSYLINTENISKLCSSNIFNLSADIDDLTTKILNEDNSGIFSNLKNILTKLWIKILFCNLKITNEDRTNRKVFKQKNNVLEIIDEIIIFILILLYHYSIKEFNLDNTKYIFSVKNTDKLLKNFTTIKYLFKEVDSDIKELNENLYIYNICYLVLLEIIKIKKNRFDYILNFLEVFTNFIKNESKIETKNETQIETQGKLK